MKLTRRSFVASATLAATSFSIGRSAQAASSYKISTNVPVGHPVANRLEAAAKSIKDDTNGEIDISLFPNSQLGGDLEVISQVRQNAIQFMTMGTAQLSNLAPVASLSGVGFAFSDTDNAFKAMDGEVGGLVRKALNDVGLHTFNEIFDNGFRQITTSSKPIEKPSDLKGVLIRVPPSPLSTSMFKAFGAAPQSISYGEIYTALQTKLVDGQENPLQLVYTSKFYEVQKYASMTNHSWDGFWFCTNGAFWKRQSQATQDILTKRFREATLAARADIASLNESVRAKLVTAGMSFVEPKRQDFVAALNTANFYKDWKEKFGAEAWSTLERYTGKLG